MDYKPIVSDDVTELILDDHATFRRLFTRIDERPDTEDLDHLWFELSPLLSAHAVAEEQVFYPRLLLAAHDDDDVKDAIHDHNQIRDAVLRADQEETGTAAWWSAVEEARRANSEHMSEEERGPLVAARERIPLEERTRIGLAFLRVRNAFPSGETGRENHDKDPETFVREHDRDSR